jgi:asparagine synthase (glutamine-hydrolysing)
VVELGLSLPGRMKLRGGKGKRIFKEAFEDLVPTEILNRRKKGFALPTGRWLAGRLHGFARELLLSQSARARGLFDPAAVSDLLDRHRAGEDHGERLWNLMVLETWHHEMVDGRSAFAREVSARADAIAREATGSGGIRATAAAVLP